MAAEPTFVTPKTEFYYGKLYSDSSCSKPVTIDVSAFTHGAINPTAKTGPSGTTEWVMARPVPTSNPKVSQCSIDYTLATANPPFPITSFVLACGSNGEYIFEAYKNTACAGEPASSRVMDTQTAVNMITGKCFVAQLDGMAPAGTYMKYDRSVVGSSDQKLC